MPAKWQSSRLRHLANPQHRQPPNAFNIRDKVTYGAHAAYAHAKAREQNRYTFHETPLFFFLYEALTDHHLRIASSPLAPLALLKAFARSRLPFPFILSPPPSSTSPIPSSQFTVGVPTSFPTHMSRQEDASFHRFCPPPSLFFPQVAAPVCHFYDLRLPT